MTPYQINLAEIAVRELSSGGYLIETRSDVGDWYLYRTSSGKIITSHVIHKLVEVGAIEPSQDGLFGDSQSYRLVKSKKTFDQYARTLWGDGYVVARANSKVAKVASGAPVRKSDFEAAKKLYAIAEGAWHD